MIASVSVFLEVLSFPLELNNAIGDESTYERTDGTNIGLVNICIVVSIKSYWRRIYGNICNTSCEFLSNVAFPLHSQQMSEI